MTGRRQATATPAGPSGTGMLAWEQPENNFTQVPNSLLQDQRLSDMARGILARIMSYKSYRTTADGEWELARRKRPDRSGEGRRAYRAAFAEMESLGYLERRRERREGGRFVTILLLHPVPAVQSDRRTGSGISA